MNIKYLVLAVAALTTTAYAVDTPTGNPAAARTAVGDRLATARKAIDAKDWTRAFSELNAAERDDPNNADVQNLLGYSYRKRATPDLAQAFAHYNNALRLNPQHKGAHEYIGEAYLSDKKPAEAEKHLAQLEAICGNKTCSEYTDLSKSIAEYKAKN
jgi:Flp pilus assembly protein TadD